jgi:exodeoxyribonuclease VII small subunit
MESSTSQTGPIAEMTFEQAMSRLEQIVEMMDDRELPLELMLDRYEEGGQLVKICETRLDLAHSRLELINRQANGDVSLEPPAEKAPAPAPRSKVSSPTKTKSTDEIRLF